MPKEVIANTSFYNIADTYVNLIYRGLIGTTIVCYPTKRAFFKEPDGAVCHTDVC